MAADYFPLTLALNRRARLLPLPANAPPPFPPQLLHTLLHGGRLLPPDRRSKQTRPPPPFPLPAHGILPLSLTVTVSLPSVARTSHRLISPSPRHFISLFH